MPDPSSLCVSPQPPQYKLDPRLARLLGVHTQTRASIMQALWLYIKHNKLQDSHEKEYINCNRYFRQVSAHTTRFWEERTLFPHTVKPEKNIFWLKTHSSLNLWPFPRLWLEPSSLLCTKQGWVTPPVLCGSFGGHGQLTLCSASPQIFNCVRMRFSEIPMKLAGLLQHPDPIIINHTIRWGWRGRGAAFQGLGGSVGCRDTGCPPGWVWEGRAGTVESPT